MSSPDNQPGSRLPSRVKRLHADGRLEARHPRLMASGVIVIFSERAVSEGPAGVGTSVLCTTRDGAREERGGYEATARVKVLMMA